MRCYFCAVKRKKYLLEKVLVTGYAQFPREILKPPRSVAERIYKNIQRWSVMPRGGHFAAMEQPEALAREITEFFRPLRG